MPTILFVGLGSFLSYILCLIFIAGMTNEVAPKYGYDPRQIHRQMFRILVSAFWCGVTLSGVSILIYVSAMWQWPVVLQVLALYFINAALPIAFVFYAFWRNVHFMMKFPH